MTINATGAWLLALYVATADATNADRTKLTGTIQNDIIKEYLSRGTYIFPPAPSLKLIKDTIIFSGQELPRWNPTNVCSYHLQEAGATPVQELAFALATAIAVLDTVKASGEVSPAEFGAMFGRISFFVNAGLRFITEICKMRAFTELWEEIGRTRYGVTDPKFLQFRYGVQVNSLGLTEPQPENNVSRILLEMLAVTLSKRARARAVQLPAWNEALGLPRPWDQQWSLRMQQVLAYETDLLEYGDIFDGSPEIERKVQSLKEEAQAELATIDRMGGAVAAIDYMKRRLVESNADRLAPHRNRRPRGDRRQSLHRDEVSPLASGTAAIEVVDPAMEAEQIAHLQAWRTKRDSKAAAKALAALDRRRQRRRQRHARLHRLRQSRRHHRRMGHHPARSLRRISRTHRRRRRQHHIGAKTDKIAAIRAYVEAVSRDLGRRIKFLVGKPGLDGHSNGAEQIAVRARDCGMDVVYEGIRLTPSQIARTAVDEAVHVVGLSILSGSHVPLVQRRARPPARRRRRRYPPRRRRHHPPRRRSALEGRRRRRRLHPQGFRPQRHHDRNRAAGRWDSEGGVRGHISSESRSRNRT